LGVGFRETLLFTGDYACIARQGHSVVGSKLTLQTFRGAEHVRITPKGVSPKADVVGKALGSRKVGATVAAEVSSFYALLAMVASTDLLATIPRQLAVSMQTLAGVRVFEPPFALPRLKVSLYWSERFHREPANVWLRRLYAGLFRDS
jgi:DNA-binding transcriptional LysR family regulator